jgi:hypothetical protein
MSLKIVDNNHSFKLPKSEVNTYNKLLAIVTNLFGDIKGLQHRLFYQR